MDRRQQKTRAAIFDAFCRLLETKHFNQITVQEIIQEANVGRSTFYAHFDTKDALLKEMCTNIFEHIFSKDLIGEDSHDFSSRQIGLQERLTHLLYHLQDQKREIMSLFFCDSSEWFLEYFKEYLSILFAQYLSDKKCFAPKDFLQNHLTGSFTEAVKWWLKNGMRDTPEKIAAYFMDVIG